jgi:hypothetical protein
MVKDRYKGLKVEIRIKDRSKGFDIELSLVPE